MIPAPITAISTFSAIRAFLLCHYPNHPVCSGFITTTLPCSGQTPNRSRKPYHATVALTAGLRRKWNGIGFGTVTG